MLYTAVEPEDRYHPVISLHHMGNASIQRLSQTVSRPGHSFLKEQTRIALVLGLGLGLARHEVLQHCGNVTKADDGVFRPDTIQCRA